MYIFPPLFFGKMGNFINIFLKDLPTQAMYFINSRDKCTTRVYERVERIFVVIVKPGNGIRNFMIILLMITLFY